MALVAPTAYASAGGTVSSTALALTAAPFSFSQPNLDAADQMRVTCTGQAVAFRYDGSVAVAASHIIPVNGEVIIRGNQNIQQFQIIRAGGSDGTVYITLEKFT